MGLQTTGFEYVVALAGNPNTGKSTLFNALTGLRQHTGNWPGKTVTRAEGAFARAGRCYKLVDLPGTYSLLSASTDEEIARDFILFGQPDCVVVVADATSLERNLNLVFQVMEITSRTIVCVNLMDEARRRGITIDTDRLADRLGVPVAGASARTGEGVPQLIDHVARVATGEITPEPRLPKTPPRLEEAVRRMIPLIEELAPGLPNARWIAYRLIEGDHHIRQALEHGALRRLSRARTVDAGAPPQHARAGHEAGPERPALDWSRS
ncbi:MAG: iron transporter FeoB [Phycisphaeraceae bacterium]|nr:iron transporter FeoB [Phycisphaeraceae bacterium]